MDKYEYKVRAEEIKELIAQGEYAQAAEIADTIDWRRVKSVMMLCTISDLYKINRRYEDARDMLLLAYERRPGGRTICYSLCELSIKLEEFVQAVEYYKEFVQVAPKDAGRFILQYKLYEAQDVSLEERIEVLEELKKRDYREKWAYELAYLYHRVGLATRCVEECDELILWFGEGKYVIKAMELKMLHQPLSAKQQEKYDRRFESAAYNEDAGYAAQSQEVAQVVQPVAVAQTYVAQPDMTADTIVYDRDQLNAQINARLNAQANVAVSVQPEEQMIVPEEVQEFAEEPVTEAVQEEEFDIQVKTLDMGQYNTMNLQAELAAGLREVLGDNGNGRENPITQAIIAPMMASDDTETLDYPQIDEVSEDDLGPEQEEMESSEVFFGETGEISAEEFAVYGANEEEPVEYEAVTYEQADVETEYHAQNAYVYENVAEEPVYVEATYEESVYEPVEEDATTYEESLYEEPTYEEAEAEEDVYAEQTEEEPTVYEKAVKSLDTEFLPYEETVDDYATREMNISAEALAAYVAPDLDTWEAEPETIEELITEEVLEDMAEAEEDAEYVAPVEEAYEVEEAAYEAPAGDVFEAEEDKDFTAAIVMEQLRRENNGEVEEDVLYAEPPKEIASILSQGDDGQISLIVPESELIEKQITGQMNMEDILAEWERIKKENEEKRKEEVRQHVLQHTDNMFTEFEASVRDGLLEQIENGEISVEEAVAVSEGIVEEPVETEDFFSEDEEDLEIIDDLDEEINNGESLGEIVDIIEMVTGEIDAKAVAAATLGTTALGAAAFGGAVFSADEAEDQTEEIAEVEEYASYEEPVEEETVVEEPAAEEEAFVEAEEFIGFETAEDETEEIAEVEEFTSFEVPAEEPVEEFVEEFTSFEVPAEEPVEEFVEEFTSFEVPAEEPVEEIVEEFTSFEVPAEEPVEEFVEEFTSFEVTAEEPVEEFVEEFTSFEVPAEEPVEEFTSFEVPGEAVETEETYVEEAIDAGEVATEEADVAEVAEEIIEAATEQPEDDEIEHEFAYIANDGDSEETAESEESTEETKEEIEREQETLRELTKEEKELYAPFIQSKAGKEQIIKALDSISMAAFAGNLVITGEEGVDTIGLAKNIIREIQMNDRNFSGKVAKISGEALNRKDVEEILRNLKNGALIVQKAPDMTSETTETLYKSLQQESNGIIVVLEGTKKTINRLLSQHEDLAECFNARVDVEALSNDTLVAFGRQYAKEREYAIDEFGILALHTRIEDLQTSDHMVTVVEVKDIVDEAINRANKKSMGHFLDILFARRYDSEDMVILGEKDFAK